VVFISPDSFSTALQPLISNGQNEGWTVGLLTIENIETTYQGANRRDKIKAAIADLRNNGLEIVTFVGDASYIGNPAYDIIPIFYYYCPEIGYWRDDRATLFDYVDFDGDRIPDVPWTVVPARTISDVEHFVTHSLLYASLDPTDPKLDTALWLVEDEDVEGQSGARVRELADSLMNDPALSQFNRTVLYDSDIPYGYLNRENAFVAQADNGVGIVFGMGTSSSRTNLVEFAYGCWGFTVDGKLTENNMIPPYFILCCGSGEYDRPANPDCGLDFVSQFLFSPELKGASFWIGATGDTRYWSNYLLGKNLVEQMFVYGARTTAEAFFGAIRKCIQEEPLMQEVWEGYNAYGSPFHVTHGMIATTTASRNLPRYENRLRQNYPNPFNPTTTIAYSIARTSHVTLKIYGVTGRLVATLVDEVQKAGPHEVRWNASGLASGVYFYRLKAGSFSETRKLVVVK
jgi:hypothetical protein